MNFRTFEQLNDCIYKNLHKIPRDIDLVVGIPRSGLLVANIIGLFRNLPISDVLGLASGTSIETGDTRKSSDWIKHTNQAKKVLVVDDSISAGDAIRKAKQRIHQARLTCEIIFCAVYALPTNTTQVDIFFEICNHPRMFEWNYMHHWGLECACVDIDGVLCDDPQFIESHNEKKYREFILNATPKIIPTKPIGYLVTCRKENYRKETEQWLKNNNVQFKQLVMLNDIPYKKPIQNYEYGEYKGKFYKSTHCFIFIESNYEQATEICRISGKQVFCTENRILINPENLLSHISIIKRDFCITIKRVVKKLIRKLY